MEPRFSVYLQKLVNLYPSGAAILQEPLNEDIGLNQLTSLLKELLLASFPRTLSNLSPGRGGGIFGGLRGF